MGITSFSIELLSKYITNDIKSVVELGAQNLYDKSYGNRTPYANEFYENLDIDYTCIDLNGENNALKIDLSQDHIVDGQFDLVTDFGTSEHVGTNGRHDINAIRNCWATKHKLLKAGGLMINENPMTGNWPGHGFNYYTIEFYHRLADRQGYHILDIGVVAAMGNTTDGHNIYCVLKKIDVKPFMSVDEFVELGIKTS